MRRCCCPERNRRPESLPGCGIGVDFNPIRAWLGHVSLETTNRYAEVDLEMKAKALQMCADDGMESMHDGSPSWHSDGKLMTFLASL